MKVRFASPLTLIVAALITACGGSPAMRAAESGDYAAMRTDLASRQKAGNLGNDEARNLAVKVLAYEIANTKGDDGAKRIKEARACTPDIDSVLEKRMTIHDAGGAEAAIALFEDGKLQGPDAREYLDDPDDRWRAVGVSALIRDIDSPRRRAAMLDPSPIVRRAAINASALAGDEGDANVLFDTVRLDPEPMVKTQALRALALLAGDRGPGARASRIAPEMSLRFVDLWAAGDDAIREDIASELSISPLYEAGGRERLRTLLAEGHGPGVLAGAGAVARRPEPTADSDKDLRAQAVGILVRSIESGSKRERSHAIATSPLFPPIVEALKKAKNDDDVAVRLAILARLTQVASERISAMKDLEAIAGNKDNEELSARAKLALASAGDGRIQAWIEEDLGSKTPLIRLGAVTALAALGREARGAVLFSDEDATVRTRAACLVAATARIRK